MDILETYVKTPTRETVQTLAEYHQRSFRSITAQLSRAGVYRKQPYRTKTGEKPINKEELLEVLAKVMDVDSIELEGLEKAPKLVLRKIILAIDSKALDYLKDKS